MDKPKLDKLIEEKIEWDTRMMFQAFQDKQVSKMLGIIKNRKIVKAESTISGLNLEGDVYFTFSDGSSFRMNNQIITNVSKLGKWFYQFPTRFMDVVNADGSKFSNPSETRMKELF